MIFGGWFTMTWISRVCDNVFPLSLEKNNIRKALLEWNYEGEMYDSGELEEFCGLCGHQNIRYLFEIVNKHNSNSLLIGSECIIKFEIPVLNDGGSRFGNVDGTKKVHRDRRKLVIESKEKHVVNSLIILKGLDSDFDIESFIQYFNKRKVFTPNQLATLIWRLDRAGVEYNKSNFKLSIARKVEKEQLNNLEEWRLKKIFHCMSYSQKKFIENKVGRLH